MSVAPAKVVHIEDDAWFAQALREMIWRWPEVCLTGTAHTGAAGVGLCSRVDPAIALVDLRLPDMDGFDVAALLSGLPVAPRIIFLTGRADDFALFRFSRMPGTSLIWKSPAVVRELRVAIGDVLAGRVYRSPKVREQLDRLRRDPQAFFKLLSDSDLELLPWFGRGVADGDIARQTGRSALTIKWRRHRIMQKLNLHRSAELMRWVLEKGFVDSGAPLASWDATD